MQIRDLDWLVTVSEIEHVTDAAAVLGTNQPTLSRALARVESELGIRVFERSHDGVHPTPTGELVVAAARDLTERYGQLLADLETALDPDAGVVRLAFLDSIATSLVPRVLHEVHGQAPKVRVLLRQEPGHEIAADLASGAVDLAITSPRPEGPFGWLPLQEERLVLTVPAQHRLRDRKRLNLAAIADDELVTTPLGFGYRNLVDGLLREAGVAPVVSFESQDLATIEGLVAAGPRGGDPARAVRRTVRHRRHPHHRGRGQTHHRADLALRPGAVSTRGEVPRARLPARLTSSRP